MDQQLKHPLRDKHSQQQAGQHPAQSPVTSVDGTVATHPIDGSQYLDVVEEQEYADRRPSPEEQKPRFSYLHHPADENADNADDEDQ